MPPSRWKRLVMKSSTSSESTVEKPITGQIWLVMGVKGVIVNKGSNSEEWKAVRGFQD